MKPLLLLTFALFTQSAQADFSCLTLTDSGEYVSLSYSAEKVEVWHWGSSRNTHKADYQVNESHGMRFGWVESLKKSVDHSTWKDMPSQLTLNHFVQQKTYVLSGLLPKPVYFGELECEETMPSSKVSEPKVCLSGQQLCGNKCISARADCHE